MRKKCSLLNDKWRKSTFINWTCFYGNDQPIHLFLRYIIYFKVRPYFVLGAVIILGVGTYVDNKHVAIEFNLNRFRGMTVLPSRIDNVANIVD